MDKENNIFDSDNIVDIKKARLALIPNWIKFFCWCFFISSCVTPIILIMPFFYKGPISLSILGFNTTSPYSFEGMLIILFFILAGIGAFGILWAKNWGLRLSLVVGIIGLLLVIINLIINGLNPFPIEPFIQIPFIIKLMKVQTYWASYNSNLNNFI